MNTRLVLFSLCLLNGVLHTMNSKVVAEEHVALMVGEGQEMTTLQIPFHYACMSKTLRDCVESSIDRRSAVPLPEISLETAQEVLYFLEHIYYQSTHDDPQRLIKIITRLSEFESNALIKILRAADYLDIRKLVRLSWDETLRRRAETISTENLGSLQVELRCSLISHRLRKILGLEYEPESVYSSVLPSDNEKSFHDRNERKVYLIPRFAVCQGHRGNVQSVCVTSDSKIVSGSHDHTIRLWDQTGKQYAACKGHERGINTLCVTGNNKIISGSHDHTIRVWNMAGNLLAVCKGHESDVLSVCVAGDNMIVSGSADNTVRVWDSEGNQRAICRGHERHVLSVCIAGDNIIVSGSADNTLRIWDSEGNQRAICNGHEKRISSVRVTGDKIVSGSWDSTIRVWNLEGNQLAVCRGHEESVLSLCVTDTNKIVSGSSDQTIRIWDMEGKQLAVCSGHRSEINDLCITKDNKIVSCGLEDGTVRVWNLAGKLLAVCIGHQGDINTICVADNNKIASASWDRTVHVWDLDSFIVLEKALSAAHSPEKSAAIWACIQKYSQPKNELHNFCNELHALMS